MERGLFKSALWGLIPPLLTVDALGSGPGVAVGAGHALGEGGDDGRLAGQDPTHGQGHDALQAAVRQQVQQESFAEFGPRDPWRGFGGFFAGVWG